MALSSRRRPDTRGVVAVLRRGEGLGMVHLLPGTDGCRPRVTHGLFQPAVAEPARRLAEWVGQHGLGRARFVGVLNRDEYRLFPHDAPDLPRAEWGLNLRWKIADRIDYPA
ncbi:MAG: hypothetical protein H7838_10735, partial [Magnetococcus sp. DMHC-8]